MANIISRRKRKSEDDLIGIMIIKQAYGSDYPDKETQHQLVINSYVDSTIISKSIIPSVDLEDGLRIHNNEGLFN